MFLFEFVNYYSSFFYIAFIKGRLRDEPPEGGLQKSTTAITYLSTFYLKSLYNRRQYLNAEEGDGQPKKLQQWEEDFMLESWDQMSLFYEYLELVIQFGFVTIFVSTFPLASLFALINNVLEIRLDAWKMLQNFKRPVAQRVKDIGIWYSILDAIGKLSVFTNSMIIAFTTDIIPRLVYFVRLGHLNDYFDSTLSIYEIKPDDLYPPNNATNCLYTAYRDPPWVYDNTGMSYKKTEEHWVMLIWRIVFVVVFQNVVAAINSLLKVTIADVPRSVLLSKRRHAYLTNELIIRHELLSKAAKSKAAKAKKNDHYRRPPPSPPSSHLQPHHSSPTTRF